MRTAGAQTGKRRRITVRELGGFAEGVDDERDRLNVIAFQIPSEGVVRLRPSGARHECVWCSVPAASLYRATSLHEAPEMSASLAARSVNFLAARSVRTVVRKQAVAKTAVHSTRRTLTVSTRAMGAKIPEGDHFTMADQPARFAKGKADNNSRMLTTDYYDGTFLKGQRVLVTGGNRGIGLALVEELVDCGADVVVMGRGSSDELDALEGVQVITGCDVTDTKSVEAAVAKVTEPVDILINNAGYFYEPLETITSMNFDEELKMIDICAVGPLRVSSMMFNAGKIKAPGGKIAMITSQGGSVAWRVVQNPTGHDYGHHMSKSAANMGGVLLAQELAPKGVCVQMLHPGFNKTGMTKKYEKIWEVEGAVDASMGAKRVLHEVKLMSPEYNGLFINCEDGLQIPW